MVIVLAIVTIIIFVLVDFGLRSFLRKREESKLRRERAEALDIGLRLEFADESDSLKRVEVDQPKARILAVDDEPVVLDSFRKILVLEGYSVDTVETAQEALSLIRKHPYDFVFTDLKMPGMDGLDLTKAVHHLRPDIDVVMITGYGTIETAVDAMRFGAVDYVQKPFTADELAEFTKRCLLRREDRLEQQKPPVVKVVTAPGTESDSPHVINVPGGLYVSPQHTWVGIGVTGEARVGLDDLALKTLGALDEIEFPTKSARITRGEPLFVARKDNRRLVFPSPLTGRVTKANHDLAYQLDVLLNRPATQAWICAIEPIRLSEELSAMRIGADAKDWYEQQVLELWRHLESEPGAAPADQDGSTMRWIAFESAYLKSSDQGVAV